MTRRRPRMSAMRPPMIRPIPAGVAVTRVKMAIVVAENPLESSRYPFWKRLAGATKKLASSATAASTTNRRRSIGGDTTCGRSKRRVSGRRLAMSTATSSQISATA
jgi:hypothetical protein